MSRNIHEVGGRSIRIDKMDHDGVRLFDVARRRPREHWLVGVEPTLDLAIEIGLFLGRPQPALV